MKFVVISLFTFFVYNFSLAQNPEGFDKMAKNMAGKKAPTISKESIDQILSSNKTIIFLDAREEKEFQVSHIPNAIWIGYEKIDWDKINSLNKNATIVVYCSVGYRSGDLAEQMKKKGFKNVKNLYGGLFNWANNGGKMISLDNKITTRIHGYNEDWSKWLNSKRITIVF